MRRVWRLLTSMRTTAVLLAVLSGLLVLNVAVPQQATNPEGYARLAREGGAGRFLVATLGLGNVATSPPFLAAIALFFANLAAVLVDRLGATIQRLRFTAPTPARLEALLEGAPVVETPAGGDPLPRVESVLATLGYRTLRVGDATAWGVKHRLALAGFPAFHLAFFLLAAGGLQLYLTREVVTLVATEGQTVNSAGAGVVRRAPMGAPNPVELTVQDVTFELVDGAPVDLAARLTLEGPEGSERLARINHPAAWGDLTVLTESAGLSPVLWLQDAAGFTLDRVAVVVKGQGGLPTRVKFMDDAVEVVIEPVERGPGFPSRRELPTATITMRVTERGRKAFEGALRPGQSVEVAGASLRFESVRYWVALRLVSERGGGVLVAGFLLAIAGIAWRMLWHRREVAVAVRGGRILVGGRSEFYPGRFAGELDGLRALLRAELARESRP